MHYLKIGFHFPYGEYLSLECLSKSIAFCADIGCACVDLDFGRPCNPPLSVTVINGFLLTPEVCLCEFARVDGLPVFPFR